MIMLGEFGFGRRWSWPVLIHSSQDQVTCSIVDTITVYIPTMVRAFCHWQNGKVTWQQVLLNELFSLSFFFFSD